MSPLAAQAGGVTGRLVQVRAADTVPIAGTVVLHRLSVQAQGPVDTARVGPDGRFAFRFPADTMSLLLVSSRFAGIEYFSRPLRVQRGLVDSVNVTVHDTSSTAPLGLAERYLLVSRATQGGRRSVLDLLVVRNRTALTRTAPDSTSPSWTFPLPREAADLVAGEGEFSAAAFDQRGDTLRYLAPVLPGDRQLVVRYTVPAAGLEFPTPPTADSTVVLLEEREAKVATRGFSRRDSTAIDGQAYWRWVGSMPEGGTIELDFGGGASGRDPLPFLVAVLALALAAGVAVALRRRPRPVAAPAPPPAAPDEVTRLVEAIARLDAEHAGREAELDDATRARYAGERAALRAQLDRALAARGAGR